MDGLKWEALGVLVAILLPIIGGFSGVFVLLLKQKGTLGKMLGELAGLKNKMISLEKQFEKQSDQNREEHTRMWTRIDDHERRISRMEK